MAMNRRLRRGKDLQDVCITTYTFCHVLYTNAAYSLASADHMYFVQHHERRSPVVGITNAALLSLSAHVVLHPNYLKLWGMHSGEGRTSACRCKAVELVVDAS
jgi:hypothetical protein